MSKLDRLRQIQVKVPDVGKVIRVHAKPDRFAIWIAKAVVFVLTPGRYRRLLAPEAYEAQLAFLKGVTDSERWRKACNDESRRKRTEALENKLFPGMMTHF